jgi:hypothetical protein
VRRCIRCAQITDAVQKPFREGRRRAARALRGDDAIAFIIKCRDFAKHNEIAALDFLPEDFNGAKCYAMACQYRREQEIEVRIDRAVGQPPRVETRLGEPVFPRLRRGVVQKPRTLQPLCQVGGAALNIGGTRFRFVGAIENPRRDGFFRQIDEVGDQHIVLFAIELLPGLRIREFNRQAGMLLQEVGERGNKPPCCDGGQAGNGNMLAVARDPNILAGSGNGQQ